jgi:hypothetical protein
MTMAKKITGFVDIPNPPTGTETKANDEFEEKARIKAEKVADDERKAKQKKKDEDKKTKPASYTIPVYLKVWLQDQADQMTSDKSVEGRFSASNLVTQLIKEFKDKVEGKS